MNILNWVRYACKLLVTKWLVAYHGAVGERSRMISEYVGLGDIAMQSRKCSLAEPCLWVVRV